MKLCRFKKKDDHHHATRIGLVNGDSTVSDLTAAGIEKLTRLLEAEDPVALVGHLAKLSLPRLPLAEIQLLAPVGWQEVWAAGVTYLRSKAARMEESDFSASAYDKVYAAERPEIFFKSLPQKVVAPGEAVGIRRDAKWSVPEPELALVMNSRGKIVGHTIGNDMSSRDIEGENLLYLPQAKTYQRSCAIGPWIVLGTPEAQAREWTIQLNIERDGNNVFTGETSVRQIKRRFEELAEFLFRSQVFPYGAILLTGTGIVPPDTFTLKERDIVRIEISGIGVLENTVTVV
ncbi:MAG TPA: fumarylacetoacetate hydrolase family protein [Verrucomicrobiae bacterium]